MTVLFPAIRPYKTYHWQVDAVHSLYVEESGNEHGLAVLYLHGGPGGGCAAFNRQYFDPNVFRIVLFDQRGCGRSRPHVDLRNNTTQHLIEDIEFIRNRLGIRQWMLFGGSWGSTLALLYAQAYPQHVLGMVLRGVFLARQRDIDWFFQSGAGRFYPRQWQRFVSLVPAHRQNDIVGYYYRHLLTGADELKRMAAAKHWAAWEAHCATLVADESDMRNKLNSSSALALACLEAHYMVNRCFIGENQVLQNMHRLAGIPGIIVHGQYDMICPLEQALLLHQHWPGSELNVVPGVGHAATEKPTLAELVDAVGTMVQRLR